MTHEGMIVVVALLAACFPGARASCLPDAVEASSTLEPVRISVRNWRSHQLLAHLFKIAVEDLLGVRVIFVPQDAALAAALGLDSTASASLGGTSHQYDRLAEGLIDVELESWQVSFDDERYQRHVVSDGTVLDLGSQGFQGRVGLYLGPLKVLGEHLPRAIEFWRSHTQQETLELFPSGGSLDLSSLTGGLLECSDSFNAEVQDQYPGLPPWCSEGRWVPAHCVGNPSCREIYHISPRRFSGYLEQVINSLQLNYTVAYTGSHHEQVIMDLVAAGQPVLFYNWEPNTFLDEGRSDGTRLLFEPYTMGCDAGWKQGAHHPLGSNVRCDSPATILGKLVRGELRSRHPTVLHLLQRFSVSSAEILELMRASERMEQTLQPEPAASLAFRSAEASACDWARRNAARLWSWVPSCPTNFKLEPASLTCIVDCPAYGPPLCSPCFDSRATVDESVPPVKLAVRQWLSHNILTHIARIFIEEQLGVRVSLVPEDEDLGAELRLSTHTVAGGTSEQYYALAEGVLDVELESWQVSFDDSRYQRHVVNEGKVIDLGSQGFQGIVGLYMGPRSALADILPEAVEYWRSHTRSEVLSAFPPNGTLDLVSLYGGDLQQSDCNEAFNEEKWLEFPQYPKGFWCSLGRWVPEHCVGNPSCREIYHISPRRLAGYLEQIISNLKLNYTVAYTGVHHEEVVMDMVRAGRPVIFYSWEPNAFLDASKADAVRLVFPPHTLGCDSDWKDGQKHPRGAVQCDYSANNLGKLVSLQLSRDYPRIFEFLRVFTVSRTEIMETMLEVDRLSSNFTGGATSATQQRYLASASAACSFLRRNLGRSRVWMPPCPAGSVKPENTTGYYHCVACTPGRFYSGGRGLDSEVTGCEVCPIGTFAAEAGSTSCSTCPKGSFNEETGQSECSYCRPGSFGSIKNLEACSSCPEGRYTAELGSMVCHLCEPGKVASLSGLTGCTPCAQGSFGTEPGGTACTDCNSSSTTMLMGASSYKQCVCRAGTYYHNGKRNCEPCLSLASTGLVCLGGHPVADWDVPDETIRLEPGFMAKRTWEDEEPFAVYFCVDRATRCPGQRNPLAGTTMCHGGFDPQSAQCARCNRGFYQHNSESCRPCEDLDLFGVVLLIKFAGGLLVQFVLVMYLYFMFNRPTDGFVTLSLLVTYVQLNQQLANLPLLWPTLLSWWFQLNDSLSITGFVNFFALRFECTAGSGLWQDLLLQLLTPPILVFHLAAGWALGRLVRRPLKINFLLNTYGVIVKGLFITIASMPLRLFIAETMPGGKVMVRTLPDVEVGSQRWLQAVPVAVFSFLVYCAPFLAYVAVAVVKAPRWAAEWPGFMERYRFAFGVLRPDRWWWCLMQLVYGLGCMAVQVATPSTHFRIFVMTILVLVYGFLCFHLQPFNFAKNNLVEACLQIGLLFFLIIANTFIDQDSLGPEELQTKRVVFARIAMVVLLMGILYALQVFVIWLAPNWFPRIFVGNLSQGVRVYKLAEDFRGLAAEICLLPDTAFLGAVGRLSEVDQRRLQLVLRTLLPIFLGCQPSSKLSHQRVMPGVPFQVWDPRSMTLNTLETALLGGSRHHAMWQRAASQVFLMVLASDLRDQMRSSVHSVEHGKKVEPIELKFPEQANEEQFCETLRRETCLTEEELREVFQFIDYSRDGLVSPMEITVALLTRAPQLNREQEFELRELLSQLRLRKAHAEHCGPPTPGPPPSLGRNFSNGSRTPRLLPSVGRDMSSLSSPPTTPGHAPSVGRDFSFADIEAAVDFVVRMPMPKSVPRFATRLQRQQELQVAHPRSPSRSPRALSPARPSPILAARGWP